MDKTQINEMNLEDISKRKQQLLDISHKTKNLYTLEHRLKRYWRKLAKNSINLAKKAGIDTYEVHEGEHPIHSADRVNIYPSGDRVNDKELILLSKDTLPSLYRKYSFGLENYAEGMKALEKMVTDYSVLYDGNPCQDPSKS